MSRPPPLPAGAHDALLEAYAAGLAAVDPTVLVRKAVRQGLLDDWLIPPGTKREEPKGIKVLALGKAAPRMLWGLVEAGVPFHGLGVAPKGVPAPNVDTFRWLPGDHPVPGPASFAAGQEVLAWIDALASDEPVLILLSGGASACAEVPAAGVTTDALRVQWAAWLRGGLAVEDMNRERARLSVLKGGQLGERLLARTRRARVWLLADTVREQASAAVGSGPFHVQGRSDAIPHRVLAGTDEMVVAAGLRLAALGFNVHRHGRRVDGAAPLAVDAFLSAARSLTGSGVALVGGGECTAAVPPGAPPGGRCQESALLGARWLWQAGDPATLFACLASDGVDGSTDAAGAIVGSTDWDGTAPVALAEHGAHKYLDRRGRLVHMGPTGTVVNDLWIALRPPS